MNIGATLAPNRRHCQNLRSMDVLLLKLPRPSRPRFPRALRTSDRYSKLWETLAGNWTSRETWALRCRCSFIPCNTPSRWLREVRRGKISSPAHAMPQAPLKCRVWTSDPRARAMGSRTRRPHATLACKTRTMWITYSCNAAMCERSGIWSFSTSGWRLPFLLRKIPCIGGQWLGATSIADEGLIPSSSWPLGRSGSSGMLESLVELNSNLIQRKCLTEFSRRLRSGRRPERVV